MTQIEIIKALSDNYIYVLHNPINKQTAVIDPGEAQPVIELLEKKGWKLSHIFNKASFGIANTNFLVLIFFPFFVVNSI